MEDVTIYNSRPSRILEIVQDLREHDLTVGVDFDYYYFPKDDKLSRKRYTIFKFYNEIYASWFALKYGG